MQVLPNRSSLFASSSPVPQNAKPAPNHGKPNLAPKPPPVTQQQSNNISANSTVNNNVKTSVTRHQSMKSPRYTAFFLIFYIGKLTAPSILHTYRSSGPLNGLQFPPNANHFGTIRSPPGSNFNKSSESISKPGKCDNVIHYRTFILSIIYGSLNRSTNGPTT
jgi:WAS/WASL-interacting protein